MELSENARQVLGYIPYGGDKAVTVRVIAQNMDCCTLTVNNAVKELREHGYPVCASHANPRGIYMARNVAEMEEYVRMTCKRLAELNETYVAARRCLKHMKGE